MTKKKELRWWQLRVGIMVMVSLTILTIGIALVTSGGQMFKSKFTLRARMPQVEGLKPGAFVRLAGVEIGSVGRVSFSRENGLTSVLVEMRINEEFRDQLHADATAQLGTIGLLGDKYIEIIPGSPSLPLVQPGEVIPGEAPSPLEDFSAQAQSTLEQVDRLSRRFENLLVKLSEGEGSAARLINEPKIASSLAEVLAETRQLLAAINERRGALGLLANDGALAENLALSLASLKTIGASVAYGKGSLGRLAVDTTLYVQLTRVSAQLDNALTSVNEGKGMLAALMKDEHLKTEVIGLIADLRILVNDIRQNPGRYFKVSVF